MEDTYSTMIASLKSINDDLGSSINGDQFPMLIRNHLLEAVILMCSLIAFSLPRRVLLAGFTVDGIAALMILLGTDSRIKLIKAHQQDRTLHEQYASYCLFSWLGSIMMECRSIYYTISLIKCSGRCKFFLSHFFTYLVTSFAFANMLLYSTLVHKFLGGTPDLPVQLLLVVATLIEGGKILIQGTLLCKLVYPNYFIFSGLNKDQCFLLLRLLFANIVLFINSSLLFHGFYEENQTWRYCLMLVDILVIRVAFVYFILCCFLANLTKNRNMSLKEELRIWFRIISSIFKQQNQKLVLRNEQQRVDDGQQQGVNDGQQQGMDDGQQQGMDNGQQQGMDDGQQQRMDDGQQQGMDDGQQQGMDDGQQQGMDDSQQVETGNGQQVEIDDDQQQEMHNSQQQGMDDGQQVEIGNGQQQGVDNDQQEEINDDQQEGMNDDEEQIYRNFYDYYYNADHDITYRSNCSLLVVSAGPCSLPHYPIVTDGQAYSNSNYFITEVNYSSISFYEQYIIDHYYNGLILPPLIKTSEFHHYVDIQVIDQ